MLFRRGLCWVWLAAIAGGARSALQNQRSTLVAVLSRSSTLKHLPNGW